MRPISEHNSFYLAEGKQQPPKEFFKFLVRLAAPRLASPSVGVLDVGCAAGAFLNYLRSLYPEVSLTGIDVSPEFIAQAKENVPDASFLVADIYTGANLPANLFEIVFMNGVNEYFADFESWLRNIWKLTSGTAYIFGEFNPDDLDVFATIKRSGQTATTPWNVISRRSITLFLDGLGLKHEFIDWEIPIPLPRSHDDPIRSWTLEMKDGRFLAVNGAQIIHRFAVLRIDVTVRMLRLVEK